MAPRSAAARRGRGAAILLAQTIDQLADSLRRDRLRLQFLGKQAKPGVKMNEISQKIGRAGALFGR